jgi:hypothetical protein
VDGLCPPVGVEVEHVQPLVDLGRLQQGGTSLRRARHRRPRQQPVPDLLRELPGEPDRKPPAAGGHPPVEQRERGVQVLSRRAQLTQPEVAVAKLVLPAGPPDGRCIR